MSYWTDREFDMPLKEGEKRCLGEKKWTCYERRGQYRETVTNLGGVLGVINYHNSVPFCDAANINIMRKQMTQMDWDDQYVIKAISLFRSKKYESLIGELPNLTLKNTMRFFSIFTLDRLLDNSDLSIKWEGGAVNGSLWIEKNGERIVDCYVNFRDNFLSWNRDDQKKVLEYLRVHGGRFLNVYI